MAGDSWRKVVKATKQRNPKTHPKNWEEVFEHHENYVKHLAGKFAHGNETHFQDYYNAGLAGLWKAFNGGVEGKKWDGKRPFGTYAYWWVKRLIQVSREQQQLIHIPIKKLNQDFKSKNTRHSFLSLDFELPNKNLLFHNVIPDDCASPSEQLASKERQELLNLAFNKLNEAQQQVIKGRMAGLTLEDIRMKLDPNYVGKLWSKNVKRVTRERVRQIQNEAIDKLRKSVRPSLQERLLLS